MKRYSIPTIDNGVIIMHAKDGVDPLAETAKWPASWRARLSVPLAVREIQDGDLPNDTYSEAWEDTGSALVTNMAKARVAFDRRLQIAREREASRLAIREIMGEAVAAEKAALRAPINSAAATSVAELDALWPAGLERGDG